MIFLRSSPSAEIMAELMEFGVGGTWLQLMYCALPVVLSLISRVELKVQSFMKSDGFGRS